MWSRNPCDPGRRYWPPSPGRCLRGRTNSFRIFDPELFREETTRGGSGPVPYHHEPSGSQLALLHPERAEEVEGASPEEPEEAAQRAAQAMVGEASVEEVMNAGAERWKALQEQFASR